MPGVFPGLETRVAQALVPAVSREESGRGRLRVCAAPAAYWANFPGGG